MFTYTLTVNGSGNLRSDGAVIPPDDSNRDYQAYLKWLSAGGNPDPAPELPLEQQKAQARANVAAEADALVAAVVPSASAAYAFQLELAEATAWLDDSSASSAEDAPLLAALIGDLGANIDEVADAVLARQAALKGRIAEVHTVRSGLLSQIEAGTTSSAVLALVQNINWPAAADAPVSV